MNNLETFKNIYKTRIDSYASTISAQFRSIIKYATANIIIQESGTCIMNAFDYNQNKNVFTLYIGYDDIIALYEECGHVIDLFECFIKIIAHEYMHVLLKHLNVFNLRTKFINIAFGSLDYYYKKSADPFYVPARNNSTDNCIDLALLNIAGDFYINRLLNIGGSQSSFLRASNYGLPENLTDVQYYSILWHITRDEAYYEKTGQSKYLREHYWHAHETINQLYNDVKNNMTHFLIEENPTNNKIIEKWKENQSKSDIKYRDANDDSSKEIETEFNYIYIPYNNNSNNYYKPSKISEEIEKILQDEKYNNLKQPGNITGCINKINSASVGIWKEFRDALKFIENKLADLSLSKISKQDDWTKFNNRKTDDPQLLYPGSREKFGSLSIKMSKCAVIFVDVSYSMSECINPLFTLCYLLIKKMNVIIVLYDTEIKSIYKNVSNLKFEPFVAGGTDFGKAYEEYISKNLHPTKVFVISDCYDNSLNSYKDRDNFYIWHISNHSLKRYN